MATSHNVFVAGDDFKSGQTKMKSVLTDFLVSAGIKPVSIVSYNHLVSSYVYIYWFYVIANIRATMMVVICLNRSNFARRRSRKVVSWKTSSNRISYCIRRMRISITVLWSSTFPMLGIRSGRWTNTPLKFLWEGRYTKFILFCQANCCRTQ